MEKPNPERTEFARRRMKKQSGASKNSKILLLLGERFEFRENGSLIVDFDEKVIEFDPSSSNHLRRLERILKRKLLHELEPAVEHYARKLGVRFNRITIRKQRSRWGSCSANGNLSFNLWLICLPRELIRYVTWHEVAHLKEKSHGRAFWNLVGSEFNYREMEKHLSEYWPFIKKTNFLLGLGKASPLGSRSRSTPRARRSSLESPRLPS